MSEQSNDIINEKSAEHSVRTWTSIVTGMSTLMAVGYSLYLVSQWLVVIGYLLIIALALFIFGLLMFGSLWLMKYATSANWMDIGEHGSVERDLIGRSRLYSPMNTNMPKITQRKNKVTVTPAVPSIIELIDRGVITRGQLMMHMGFEHEKGGLVPVVDRWPGTFIVAGMGRSGKTRRVLTIIIQAILGNARIFILDPHRTKRDGLAKLLEPVSPWLTIGRGASESMDLARAFATEMRHRVANEYEGDGYWQPWVLICDEWSAIMTDGSLGFSEDDQELLIDLVTYCSTQYAGYNGFAGIIGQVWTNESCPTTIRRSAHKVFVHQLNHEYAQFFFRGKWATKAEELETRQCIYRQGAETKLIVTHDVPDNTAEWVASWLSEHMPIQELQPMPDRLLLPPAIVSRNGVSDMPETADSETKRETFRRMRAEKANQSTIIASVWGARPGDNAAYRSAVAEYKELLEEEKK